jgi:predicted tellurium resistance membrane protein TerC
LKLPSSQQLRARALGIGAAVVLRVLLLLSISWIIGLSEPLFAIFRFEVSGRDLVLFSGGLFLIWKSTYEIHQRLEGVEGHASARVKPAFWSVLVQIMFLDVVFALDSVITAVGMVKEIPIMILAVILAAIMMIFTSGWIGAFVERHPTIKMLALAFLLLVGFTLVMEAFHQHIPKGYIYFAMGFSVFVEMLNLRMRAAQPVALRHPYVPEK